MIQYIYFVKCPGCEDEHFDFFNDAKEFALGCVSKKPIITQTEVNRNDFGECTDHCDLGTVWSWEDVMKDTCTNDEPAKCIFTKDDLKDYIPDEDPEFADMDNSVDFDIDEDYAINESNSRGAFVNNIDTDIFNELAKGVPEAPIINSFEKCSKSAPRNALYYVNEGEEVTFYLGNIKLPQKQVTHCWITHNGEVLQTRNRQYPDDLITKFSIDLAPGDIDKAINDIKNLVNSINGVNESCSGKPIPEGMTIEQLIEEMEENEDEVECTWCEDLFDKSECRYEVDLGWLCSRCEMAIKSRGETLTFREGNYWDFLDEATTKPEWRKAGPKLFKLATDKGTAEVYQNTHGIFELTVKDKSGEYVVGGGVRVGGSTIPEDETHKTKAAAMKTAEKYLVEDFLDESVNEDTRTFEELVKDSINHLTNDLGKDPWVEDFADEVIADLENNYDMDVPEDITKYNSWCSAVACEVSRQVNNQYQLDETLEPADTPELSEIDEVSESHLALCPECGKDTFDIETGICVECGFN